jgi:serine/threonine-protein phosphatase 6 regulatory ankyrin repeat subunit A
VRILLDYQADVNTRDKNWQTPLHVCSVYNSIECARLLLSYISNIDATDRQGRSALAHAAFNGNIQLVEILLENGANTNVQDKQERRPLHWASYVGYNDIIRLLVKYGADINSLDKDLFTPLLVACASGKSEESIRLLIELGADTSAMTIHDSSIFHLACLNGHDHIVKELLYNQKLKMKTNSKGYHPLHYTAGCKQGAFCLELLINLNIDVNMAGFDGRTAMHIAALHGRTACAEILFSNGANKICFDYFLL